MSYAQQIVDHLESITAGRIVDCGDVGDHGVFGCGMVFEERDDRDDPRRWDVYRELVFPDRELLNVFGEGGDEVLAILMEGCSFLGVFVCGIDYGGVKLATGFAFISAAYLGRFQPRRHTRSRSMPQIGDLVL